MRSEGRTRRSFLKVGGGLVLGSMIPIPGCGGGSSGKKGGGVAADMQGKVVHIHSPQATTWDFGQDYCGAFVDQVVVDSMVGQRFEGERSSPPQRKPRLIGGYLGAKIQSGAKRTVSRKHLRWLTFP